MSNPARSIAAAVAEGADLPPLKGLLLQMRQAWEDEAPGLRAVELVGQWPEADPEDLLPLFYEEYCLRRDRKERPTAESLCHGLPAHRRAKLLTLLTEQIEVHDFFALPAWVGPERGKFLNYELLDELGRGGSARVFLARQPECGNRHVALKISPASREARTLGRLDHDNIMPVFNVEDGQWEHDGIRHRLSVICMPFMGTATLERVLDYASDGPQPPEKADMILAAAQIPYDAEPQEKRPPDPLLSTASYVEGVLHLGAQIADALHYTHQRQIVHGDLKLSNVLLTTSGRPKVLDFNQSDDDVSQIRRFGGTPEFMAPEQLRTVFRLNDGQRETGPRSDLFALGVMLYQLLGLRLPFEPPRGPLPPVRAAMAMIFQQLEERPPPLPGRNADVSADVDAVVQRCLAFDPNERFGDAAELAAALRALLPSPEPAAAATAPTTSPWGLRLASAAAGISIAIAAAALYIQLQPPPPPAAQSLSVDQLDVAGIEARLDRLEAQQDSRGAAQLIGDFSRTDTFAKLPVGRQAALRIRAARNHIKAKAFADAARQIGLVPPSDRQGNAPEWLAFCLLRSGQFDAAAAAYFQIPDYGSNARVLNNIGFCGEYNKAADARAMFDLALRVDPHLLPARLNRCLNAFRHPNAGEEVFEDLRHLRAAGIDGGQLHQAAARVALRLNRRSLLCLHIREAIRQGVPASQFQIAPFQEAARKPDVQAALRQPVECQNLLANLPHVVEPDGEL